MKDLPGHRAHLSRLHCSSRRQHPGGCPSKWKPEDKHGSGKDRRPTDGKKTRELEQFPLKQLWCTSVWIWFDYLNRMYFSLPLLFYINI